MMDQDPVAHAYSTVARRSQERLVFSVAFNLLEFAIKECLPVAGNGLASPNWDEFVRTRRSPVDHSGDPRVQEAIAYLLNEPPEVQKAESGRAVFRPSRLPADRADALAKALKRVRNNLFHGGKPGYTDRDKRLVEAGIQVIRAYLALKDDIRTAFLTGI